MRGTAGKDIALLVLRLSGLGLAFAHGWPKFSRFIAGQGGPFFEGVEALGFPFPVFFGWAAAISELVGGFAITLGLVTRVSALFAGFTVFVAAFGRHRLLQHILVFFGLMSAPEDVVDSWGNPERAALFWLICVALVFMGGGRFSLDGLIRSRKG